MFFASEESILSEHAYLLGVNPASILYKSTVGRYRPDNGPL